jgi:hypothetical protein
LNFGSFFADLEAGFDFSAIRFLVVLLFAAIVVIGHLVMVPRVLGRGASAGG